MENKIYRLEDFQTGNKIFRFKTIFFDQKQILRLEIRYQTLNKIVRLETRFLDQKQDFYIRKKIFRVERRLLDCKPDIQIGNKIFRLERKFLDQKQVFQIGNFYFLKKLISVQKQEKESSFLNCDLSSTMSFWFFNLVKCEICMIYLLTKFCELY